MSIEDETKQAAIVCPWCGHGAEAFTGINTDEQPGIGDSIVCSGCGKLTIRTDEGLRRPTEEEQHALDALGGIALLRVLLGALASDTPVVVPITRHSDGSFELEDDSMPEALKTQLLGYLKKVDAERKAAEVEKYVTAEIASWALAMNGEIRDIDSSWPSLSVISLFSLIKQCRESDEVMLAHLGHDEFIRGFVLAMEVLAREDGRLELRKIAGLEGDQAAPTNPAEEV